MALEVCVIGGPVRSLPPRLAVLNGVLWVLRTGAPWHDLPEPSWDRGGLPVAVHVASASPYEPHLVPAALDARFLPDLPWRLIGDWGYDSDPLDHHLLTAYGIEIIAANRRNRARTQDGRALRRARRRSKAERLFAWLHNRRRVVTRTDSFARPPGCCGPRVVQHLWPWKSASSAALSARSHLRPWLDLPPSAALA